jgi:methyl-accepting chemotaxis protein
MRSIRSLRGRVAVWMFAASSLSLVIFAIAAYIVVRIEESIERADPDVAIAEARKQVLTPLAIAAPIGLALSTAGAMWLSRRALAPVDRVIAAAREITGDNLDRRIDVPARFDELRTLVLALNELLDRIERSHRALAMFAADASVCSSVGRVAGSSHLLAAMLVAPAGAYAPISAIGETRSSAQTNL